MTHAPFSSADPRKQIPFSNVIEQACTGTIGFNKCSLLSALGAGLTGCIGGQAALADNKKLDVIAFIIGVDASMMGSWCDNEE
jgi:trehalose-6-phosphate synthase